MVRYIFIGRLAALFGLQHNMGGEREQNGEDGYWQTLVDDGVMIVLRERGTRIFNSSQSAYYRRE